MSDQTGDSNATKAGEAKTPVITFLEKIDWFKNKKAPAFLSPKRTSTPVKADEIPEKHTVVPQDKVQPQEKQEHDKTHEKAKIQEKPKTTKLPMLTIDTAIVAEELSSVGGKNITPPLTPHTSEFEKETQISPNWDQARLFKELKREKERFKKAATEADRKINVLTTALDEKAEHALSLAKQARKDERTIKELTSNISLAEGEKEQMRVENEKLVLENNELRRRINTVTASLEMLATENLELKSQVPLNETENIRAVFSIPQTTVQDQSTVHLLTAKIEEMERKLSHLQKEYLKEQQKELSYQESVQKYEKKINKLSLKNREDLKKEATRRKSAEFEVRALGQKVEELKDRLTRDGNTTSDSDDNVHEDSE